MRILASTCLFILFTLGCATTQTPRAERTPSESDELSGHGLALAAKTMPNDDKESEATAQILQSQREEAETQDFTVDGYCSDDIYFTYLKDAYLQNPSNTVRRHRESASARQKRLNAEASHFALRVMQGPTPSYFGGLPIVSSPKIDRWLFYFKTKGRADFLKWLVRSVAYRDKVLPILEREGLPKELFYLAMVESGFSNLAKSRAQAIGTWQFMQGTAELYGLKINHWVDERRDPIKSTIAAARYLRDLYLQFGNWHLAIAAYNAGPGRIRSSIRNAGAKDFWTLADSRFIKPETKEYIPKLLASLIISSSPEAFGFAYQTEDRADDADTTVYLRHPYDLAEIAQKLATNTNDLKRWNPELLRLNTPPVMPRSQGYELRLPRNLAQRFADIEGELTVLNISNTINYKVAHGDTLQKISRRYGVAIKSILQVNPGLNPRRLKPKTLLVVPVPTITQAPHPKQKALARSPALRKNPGVE